jgi:hypothetical protein
MSVRNLLNEPGLTYRGKDELISLFCDMSWILGLMRLNLGFLSNLRGVDTFSSLISFLRDIFSQLSILTCFFLTLTSIVT